MNSSPDTVSIPKRKLIERVPWRGLLLLVSTALVTTFLWYAPEGLLGKADAIGYAVCHRIEARSFMIGDHQFSLCARCSGQYLGAFLGVFFLAFARPRRTKRPPWGIIVLLSLSVVAYAVDGLNSYLHLIPGTESLWIYEPDNLYRVITGLGLGLGLSVLLMPAFNQTVFKMCDPRPILEGWRDFGAMVGLAGVLGALVLSDNAILLYPLSLISASGVLLLLTLVYTLVWIMVLRQENKFENWRQLVYPLIAGFSVGLLQILVLDFLRYLLTGTWDGFHFG